MSGQDFQAMQRAFAAHLRDPERCPAPDGLEARRVGIYRDLIFNNMQQFLSGAFPVLSSILPAGRWHTMVRDFLRLHRSDSPYFRDIPEAFLHFLADGGADENDPPWMAALAHYEWIELVLDTRDAPAPRIAASEGDPLAAPLVWSPWAELLSYDWPVHRIGPDFRPEAPLPEPVWLLVYRDREQQVRFMVLNAMTAALIQRLEAAAGDTGEQLLRQLAADLRHPAPETIVAFGKELFEDLLARGVIWGLAAK